MGTPEENKALVARFIEGLRTGDVAMAAECFDAERYYSHAHQADLAGTWERMKASRKAPAWSDYSSESIALIADGDRVVHHSRATATQTGEIWGIPPTRRRITWDQIELWRIENDKIVEHWGGGWEMERIVRELTEST